MRFLLDTAWLNFIYYTIVDLINKVHFFVMPIKNSLPFGRSNGNINKYLRNTVLLCESESG